jgi:hypothetical protein
MKMSNVLQVTSFHVWLAEDHMLNDWPDWQIHSVCKKAINFNVGEDLITLTAAYDGPATIVTESPLLLFVPGSSVGKKASLNFLTAKQWIPPSFRVNPKEIEEQVLDEPRKVVQCSGRSAFL